MIKPHLIILGVATIILGLTVWGDQEIEINIELPSNIKEALERNEAWKLQKLIDESDIVAIVTLRTQRRISNRENVDTESSFDVKGLLKGEHDIDKTLNVYHVIPKPKSIGVGGF